MEKDSAILGRVCNLKSDFSNPENKLALSSYSWVETEGHSEVVSSHEAPSAGGRTEKRLGEGTLELP